MITIWLQDRLDVARGTSRQRWALVATTVVVAVAASCAASAGAGHRPAWGAVVAGVVALLAAARPGTHTGSFLVALVALQWVVAVDDVASPWSMAVAAGVLAVHVLLALLAVTPHSAVIEATVLRRWARRSAIAASTVLPVWLLVTIVERSEEPGRAGLTASAFLILALAALVARHRSLTPVRPAAGGP